MVEEESFDYEARKREKQSWRDEDQRRLDSGEVSPDELRDENMFLAGDDWSFDSHQPDVYLRK